MAERAAQGVQRSQILLCVLPRREPHSVVPPRTPGSDWSAGSQHQTRADLSMRVPFTTTIPAAACFSSPGGAPQGHDDWSENIEYWSIEDLHTTPAESALNVLHEQVEDLVRRLHRGSR